MPKSGTARARDLLNRVVLIAIGCLVGFSSLAGLTVASLQAFAQSESQLPAAPIQLFDDAVRAFEGDEGDMALDLLREGGDAGDIRALVLYHIAASIPSSRSQGERKAEILAAATEISNLDSNRLARRAFQIAVAHLSDDAGLTEPSTIVALLEAAAREGLSAAHLRLGIVYRDGLGVEPDPDRAIGYFEQAAERGLAGAYLHLGSAYRDGLGVEEDPGRSIGYFEQAADAGASGALIQLGLAYRNGIGVEPDARRAVEYFEQAAQAGQPAAFLQLGLAYRDGLGVEADPARAIGYLEQAEQAGLAGALIQLGLAHRDGVGVEPDADRALGYFEQAADRGLAFGASEALRTYVASTSTTDQDEALVLLTRLLEADIEDDGRWLAQVYRTLNENERVELIQLLLHAAGRPVLVDGLFGVETIVAVQDVCTDLGRTDCRGPLLRVETVRMLQDAYAASN